jgi:hypothetical protein
MHPNSSPETKKANPRKPKVLSPEARQKLIESNQNRVYTDELRAKLSEAQKRRAPLTEATRKKMSQTRLGKRLKPHSEATKEKIRQKAIGRKASLETRQKQSASHKNPSPEIRAKLSNAGKGRQITEATRAKLCKAQQNRINKPATATTKQKMSLARKGVPKSEETKQRMRLARAKQSPEAKRARREGTSKSNMLRQLSRSDFNVKGYYIAQKSIPSRVPFRSVHLELQIMKSLDSDPTVEAWNSPLVVSYSSDDGAKMWALPDFYVVYTNGQKKVIEGKGSHLLSKYIEGPKFQAVKAWCLQNGASFDIVVLKRKEKPLATIEVISWNSLT